MKNKTSTILTLIGCALCAAFGTSTALANHRSGDFALPEIMTAGDFNHDGNLDLAVNLSGFDNFAVLNGDGQGNFTLTKHVEEDTLPKAIVSGDLNGDGNLDIVSAAQWGYTIKVYLGDGAGGFQNVGQMDGDGELNRVVLADLNKDGILDIISNAPSEGKLDIYYGLGNGRFTNTFQELGDEQWPNLYAIETGDFNNDGNPDIAITYFTDTTETGTHLQILLGDGAGNFTTGQNIVVNSQCNNVRAVDLNKDGNLDLILAGAGSENETGIFVSTYLGDGHGNFTEHQFIDLGVGSIKGQIALGDFNEDGNIDFCYPQSSLGIMRHDYSTNLLIFLGDGTGSFTQGQTVTVGLEPGSTWAADFNKDGHIDIACSNRTDATLSILLGKGDGTFTTRGGFMMERHS